MKLEKGNLSKATPKEMPVVVPIKPTFDEIFEKIGLGLWELRELYRLKYGVDYEFSLRFNIGERDVRMDRIHIIEKEKK